MSKDICPNCGREAATFKTVIRGNEIIDGCERCIHYSKPSTDSAKHYREWQKKEYRRDLTQPNQREYAKAYPEDARKRWGDETFRKYS